MVDFFKENWLFLVIVVVTILLIIAGYFLYTWKNRKPFPKSVNLSEEDQKPKIQDHNVPQNQSTVKVNQLSSESISKSTDEPTTEVVSEPTIEEKVVKEAVVETDIADDLQAVEAFEEDEEDDLPEIEEFDKEERKELGRYHIIFRQKDEKWVIKREGSKKIFRALDTQKEAIAYATIKAIVQNTTYVIHKKDGKIRKQNYYKKPEE